MSLQRRVTDPRLAGITPSEITPQAVYLQRRQMVGALMAAGLLPATVHAAPDAPRGALQSRASPYSTIEKPAPYQDATHYNNFYEFGTDKADPARKAGQLRTAPWTVVVDGACAKPQTFGLEDLMRLAPLEERIYRLRCVEGWSMVIPWNGFALAEVLRRVQPMAAAKYVEFTSAAQPDTMPGLSSRVLAWPYTEGLRIDEAMHPLTTLAFGLYGEPLPGQNGAPVRLVVPWKYGFKSAKSIQRIRLVDKEPVSSWTRAAPSEYGFYSNVNPTVDHPRWSQASERRIPDDGYFSPRRKTLMFNGYEALVASMYQGMDLKRYF